MIDEIKSEELHWEEIDKNVKWISPWKYEMSFHIDFNSKDSLINFHYDDSNDFVKNYFTIGVQIGEHVVNHTPRFKSFEEAVNYICSL